MDRWIIEHIAKLGFICEIYQKTKKRECFSNDPYHHTKSKFCIIWGTENGNFYLNFWKSADRPLLLVDLRSFFYLCFYPSFLDCIFRNYEIVRFFDNNFLMCFSDCICVSLRIICVHLRFVGNKLFVLFVCSDLQCTVYKFRFKYIDSKVDVYIRICKICDRNIKNRFIKAVGYRDKSVLNWPFPLKVHQKMR